MTPAFRTGGLFFGAFAAVVGSLMVVGEMWHEHDGWLAIAWLIAALWGAMSVSVIWERHNRFEQILREHGLYPKTLR